MCGMKLTAEVLGNDVHSSEREHVTPESRWVVGYKTGLERGFKLGYEVARKDPKATEVTIYQGPLEGRWLANAEGRIERANGLSPSLQSRQR